MRAGIPTAASRPQHSQGQAEGLPPQGGWRPRGAAAAAPIVAASLHGHELLGVRR